MSTILIVEDESVLRKALRMKLEGSKYSVLEARDGVEALEVLSRETPDVILLDVVMPRMDGITFLRQWRTQQNEKQNIPIIILSNLADGEKVKNCIENGVYDYLIKSDWSLEDVLEKVESKLKK